MDNRRQPRPSGFRPGQLIQGQVEALIDPGHVVIRVDGMTLVAEARTELNPGDRVLLRAGAAGYPTRFQVVSRKGPGLCGLHVRV